MHLSNPDDPDYVLAIELVRQNPFNIQNVPTPLVDDRLLRLARKGNVWSIDAWVASLAKEHKALGKERSSLVFYDIGVVRGYVDL